MDDPMGFIREVLGDAGEPYAKQREIIDAVLRSRRVSVAGCNGSGKDWTVARIILWWIGTQPQAKVIVTGPTQRQADEDAIAGAQATAGDAAISGILGLS
ncbi:MAG: hypothetical protein O2826_03480 [Chloroflexi bacterium]|nr:hypothetical protein [Chloroflexota bacterium]